MKADRPLLFAIAGAPIFVVLAIANSAGYRYGVSDLNFYLPAAFLRVDSSLFPRDSALLETQGKLALTDEVLGAALRAGDAVGLGVPGVVYLLHLATLLLLFVAALLLGRALFVSHWSVAAFTGALTLRHAVARTGVNTLEGYFHPRVTAFALGTLALAAFLRRGVWTALAVGAMAAAVHPTTGLWFLVCIGVAGLVSERGSRAALAGAGVLTAAAFLYAVTAGPLSGRVQAMDAAWLAAIGDRDYLFPDRWPIDAWLTCAAYVALLAVAARARHRAGRLERREAGLLAGAAALVALFSTALPLLAARSALAVQFQPARVFWIVDLLATAAVIWLVAERRVLRPRAAALLAVLLLVFSGARGVYLLTVRFPERSIAAVTPPDSAWSRAMEWASSTDRNSHWIAHPNHAFLYGSGVRVSAKRDVFLEGTKDRAIAMYDRPLAMRVAARERAIADFDALDAGALRRLARQHGLDYAITETRLPLPIAYRNEQFYVYRLR